MDEDLDSKQPDPRPPRHSFAESWKEEDTSPQDEEENNSLVNKRSAKKHFANQPGFHQSPSVLELCCCRRKFMAFSLTY